MSKPLNLLVAGLATGGVYALLSMGVVLIYRVSRVVNLAHGGIGVLSTYVFYFALDQSLGLPVGLSFVITLGVGAALGAVCERVFVAPVRRDGQLPTLIMTIAFLLIVTELSVQVWGSNQPVIPSIFSDRTISIGSTGVTVHQLGTGLIALALGLGLSLLLTRTRYGTAIEAIAEDPGGARLVGLPVRAIVVGTWAVGGASAALAGMLQIHLNSLDPISLTLVLIPALVAAVFGGFSSFGAAALGSVAIGLVFSFGQGYATQAGSANVMVFVLLLAVLLIGRRGDIAPSAVPEF